MKTTIFFFFILFVLQMNANAQVDSIPKNIIYVEAGGPSIIASLNYERQIYSKARFGIRAGIGFGSTRLIDFNRKFNPDFSIPIGVLGSYRIISFEKSKIDFELGIGNNITSIVRSNVQFEPERKLASHGYIKTGVSLQTGFNLFVRIAYSPILVDYTVLRHWGSFSLGYTF